MPNACSACIYWDVLALDAARGHCRFNAPANATAYPPYISWPVTGGNDWCGQFESTPPAALMPVVSGVVPAPAPTAAVAAVMMGLGASQGFFITPNRTGRVVALITGCCANDSANGGLTVTGYHGTGAAPANGAAPSGALWSTTQHYFMAAAKDVSGFTVIGGNPSLALGVPVWFDVAVAATGGGNASITDVQGLLYEL